MIKRMRSLKEKLYGNKSVEAKIKTPKKVKVDEGEKSSKKSKKSKKK